jgi:hypothetical protein
LFTASLVAQMLVLIPSVQPREEVASGASKILGAAVALLVILQ